MTKIEMSQLIVQRLYNSQKPYPADHGEVVRYAKNHKKAEIKYWYNRAVKLIAAQKVEHSERRDAGAYAITEKGLRCVTCGSDIEMC